MNKIDREQMNRTLNEFNAYITKIEQLLLNAFPCCTNVYTKPSGMGFVIGIGRFCGNRCLVIKYTGGNQDFRPLREAPVADRVKVRSEHIEELIRTLHAESNELYGSIRDANKDMADFFRKMPGQAPL